MEFICFLFGLTIPGDRSCIEDGVPRCIRRADRPPPRIIPPQQQHPHPVSRNLHGMKILKDKKRQAKQPRGFSRF
jgi:hypothetical protein